MPHSRRVMVHTLKSIPFEDWADYLDLPEMDVSEMTLRELLELAEKLKKELDTVEAIIEERKRKPHFSTCGRRLRE